VSTSKTISFIRKQTNFIKICDGALRQSTYSLHNSRNIGYTTSVKTFQLHITFYVPRNINRTQEPIYCCEI